jgi:putative ABC transport system ATP-binding protein
MALFDQLHDQGQTIILVTHEADIARHAQRQIHLLDGGVATDTAGQPQTQEASL